MNELEILDNTEKLPLSLYVGVAGMPGIFVSVVIGVELNPFQVEAHTMAGRSSPLRRKVTRYSYLVEQVSRFCNTSVKPTTYAFACRPCGIVSQHLNI